MARIFRRRRRAEPQRIGLALGSGTARGWAHIGVIAALSDAGVRVDCVAGTSIGALVGAAYASGKISSLERVVRELDWVKVVALFDMGLPRSGLFDGTKVTDSIREHVECGDIRSLAMPFCAVSTDLTTGREVHIQSGDVIEAVRASISIPGVFTPVKRDGMLLVDGGLVNPVPASVARAMGADYVIAVDLNHGTVGVEGSEEGPEGASGAAERDAAPSRAKARTGEGRLQEQVAALREKMALPSLPRLDQAKEWFSKQSMPNILEVLISSIHVMEAQITEMRLAQDPPDLLIRPALSDMRQMDFHKGDEAIAEGRRAAEEALSRSGADILP